MSKVGRPSKYSTESAATILERVSGGETLTEVCKTVGMPDRVTVYRWAEAHEDFRHAYARAREWQMESWSDEIIEISADDSRDVLEETYENSSGDTVTRRRSDNTAVNRDRLRVDSKKWLMAKLNPKRYGDKQEVEHSGTVSVTPIINLSTKTK